MAGVAAIKYEGLRTQSYEPSIESFDLGRSVSPPAEFNQPITIDDSVDEVCPVVSPDDDSTMAEFGYSGIQGEECADERTAIMDEQITDEFFGEGGEEAFQLEHAFDGDAGYRPMGAGGDESCDGTQPIGRQLFVSSAIAGENPTPSLYFEVAVTQSTHR